MAECGQAEDDHAREHRQGGEDGDEERCVFFHGGVACGRIDHFSSPQSWTEYSIATIFHWKDVTIRPPCARCQRAAPDRAWLAARRWQVSALRETFFLKSSSDRFHAFLVEGLKNNGIAMRWMEDLDLNEKNDDSRNSIVMNFHAMYACIYPYGRTD